MDKTKKRMSEKDSKAKTFKLNREYINGVELGKGTYGAVYKVNPKNNIKETYAIKQIFLESEVDTQDGIPSTSLREVAILRKLNHPNVVRSLYIN